MKVYIDGENFRHILVDILVSEKVISNSRAITDFPIRKLLTDLLDAKDLEISYYASKIKLPHGYEPSQAVLKHAAKIREFNRRWVPSLQKQNINYVKAGYLKVKNAQPCPKCGHQQEVVQEKGVDVRVAVDMITESFEGRHKQAVLFSSDTDLAPALNRLQTKSVRITYVCFGEAVNRAIAAIANETVTFTRKKIVQLAKENNG